MKKRGETPLEISVKLLEYILTKTQNAKEIASYIEKYKTVNQRWQNNKQSIINENKRHEQILKEIREGLSSLQLQCDHPDFSYEEDPAGGSDSYHSCNICGHEW